MSCGRVHVSPEAAAVLLAADRVADLDSVDWMVRSRAMFRPDEVNPAIRALKEAVLALRVARVSEIEAVTGPIARRKGKR